MVMNRICSRILLGVGCLSAYACGRTVPAEREVAVVPQPAAVECGDGTFRLTGDTPVRMVGGAESDARTPAWLPWRPSSASWAAAKPLPALP